jgi:hypothetical protein
MHCPTCKTNIDRSDIGINPSRVDFSAITVVMICPKCDKGWMVMLTSQSFVEIPDQLVPPRDDSVTVGIMSLVGIIVDEAMVAQWTDEQCMNAVDWAGAVYMEASDNDDVEIPEMPEFLEQYQQGGM